LVKPPLKISTLNKGRGPKDHIRQRYQKKTQVIRIGQVFLKISRVSIDSMDIPGNTSITSKKIIKRIHRGIEGEERAKTTHEKQGGLEIKEAGVQMALE